MVHSLDSTGWMVAWAERMKLTQKLTTGLVWRTIERLCLTIGLAGLITVGAAYADSFLAAREAVATFKSGEASDAMALLRIRRLDVEVPVFEGTHRETLKRGAGAVNGTALPGEPGNVALAAHRDTFFRPLEGLVVGDVIELARRDGTTSYRVTEISITDPLDVSVLQPTDSSVLTLITCYPFQYVGFAPDRFVVRSQAIDRSSSDG